MTDTPNKKKKIGEVISNTIFRTKSKNNELCFPTVNGYANQDFSKGCLSLSNCSQQCVRHALQAPQTNTTNSAKGGDVHLGAQCIIKQAEVHSKVHSLNHLDTTGHNFQLFPGKGEKTHREG